MFIRNAKIEDRKILSNIAYKSKAHWGYSPEFLHALKEDLEVTIEDIQNKIVFVVEDNSQLAAFYCLSKEKKKLESLFVHPNYIGNGLGNLLWNDIIEKARANGITSFTLDSDPNALQFYLKMGAKQIAEIESTLFPNRTFPLMEF
ncbi:GNAT family N-acetyltransferase, partial [Bacillus cereus]|nr:GNAT family N-acetyltransferase [Bacillus cereus]